MGRGFIHYAFPDSLRPDACVFNSAFLDYELPDGNLLHVVQSASWCRDCDHFVMAEDVPPVDALERELASLKNPTDEELQIINFIGVPIAERISEQTCRIAWRKTRRTPPKCLRCGSTDIVILPDSDEFPHPHTGERVVCVERGFADTDSWVARFTSEGVLIRHLSGRG